MEATRRLYCCPRLTAAVSAAGAGGAALVVRMGRDGALYFKITSGVHESPDLNVTEPLAFCPFCGERPDTAPAHSLDTVRIELPADDELTVVAAARSPLILVGA
jgi:hypothetical protein